MPIIPLMPFRTPSASSVQIDLSLVSPDVPFDKLSRHWDPSVDLRVRAFGSVREAFWAETGISAGERTLLSFTAVCRATKTEWSAQSSLVPEEGSWSAQCELELGGLQLAGDVELRASIVGRGRTGHPDPRYSFHEGARLWSARPRTIELEPSASIFPVTAVSFEGTQRRPIIWSVETGAAADPAAHISESLRLFVNSDLTEGIDLAQGKAPEWLMSSVRTDIQMRTFAVLSQFFDGRSSDELTITAERHRESIAAMGLHTAQQLGLSLDGVLRQFQDDPLELQELIRSKTHYLRGRAGA